ncbi:MAG: sigma-70 family RNA polymerase sigma factor [Phycisphaerales bacterium]|nr:sigma-70 family RNA polymerase sigma factor [Phycisphaerales bacterium]
MTLMTGIDQPGEEALRPLPESEPADVPRPEPPVHPPDPADRKLILGVLDGDEDAVRALVDRYDRLIRYTIFKAGRRHCERDPGWLDARANESWTGIVESLRRKGRSAIPPSIPAYFARVARNKCLDAAAKADARQTIPFESAGVPEESVNPLTDPETNPLEMLESVEQITALRECILRLSEDERVVCSEIGLILDRRWKEAAERLEMPESTLRSRWGQIFEKLRSCLEEKISKKFRA